MISEKLSGFYTKLEDKYFDVLDALDSKGIPVYKYSDFFEDKGIPSFIITIAIILLLFLLIGFIVSAPSLGSGEITVYLKDSITNQPIQNVSLRILDEQNSELFKGIASDGSKINIPAQRQGTILRLIAEKEGYNLGDSSPMIGVEGTTSTIYLDKLFVGITAQLRITDSETGTKITNAVVTARYGENIYNLNAGSDGIYKQSNIPEGEILILSISADGYNPVTQETTFFDGSIRDITLEPSEAGYVGMATVIITVSDYDGKIIDDAEVIVYNKENQAILLNKYSLQGAVSGQIQTGIPLKIVIKKEGYLNYDSDNDGGITIREKEKKIDVLMAKGGEKLVVNAVNSLGLNLGEVLIQLYKENREKIDEGITTSSGIEFNGLNSEATIFVTAYKEGFLPKRTKIRLSDTELVTLVLEEVNQSNSFRLDLFTLDEFGNTVPNALITIEEIIDGNRLPMGFEETRTSLAGYASIVVGINSVFEINAETIILQGYKTVEINEETSDNKVYLNMKKKPNVLELKLIDLMGENIIGNAIISALDGTILFDGNIENGRVFFNKYDNKIVELQIDLEDGNTFLENIYVYGKDFIEVIVYKKDSDELTPEIDFIGLESENGEETNGITPGAFYWAKFSVRWPLATEQGGVHFRTGNDNIEFADSENVALFDLSLQDSEKTFSYTYSPEPLPGNEALDRSNQGFPSEPNKWVEGIINNPKGTYIAKVKIRVSEFTAGKITINYRAWAQVQDETYRMPFDSVLENNNYSEEKSGLYAETLKKDLTLYESLPECNDNVCIAFNFVDKEENYFDITSFEALEGQVYALEAEFTSIEGDYLQVNISTDSNLAFLGTQSSNFSFMEDTGYIDSKTVSSVVSLTANGKQKIRFYFVTKNIGTTILNFVASGKEDLEKIISFESVIEKQMIVELSEKKIPLGRNFTIKVLEQNLNGINNALIKIINKQGEVVKSIVGDNTDGKGRDGLYRIQNDLTQGIYSVIISAQKYKEKKEHFVITNQEILSFPEELNVKMLFEEKTKTISAKLTNNSEFNVSEINVVVEDTTNFNVEVLNAPSISKKQSQTIQIVVTYIGSEESVEENLGIKINGMIEGTFMTSIESTLNTVYNRSIESSCLKLTPTTLKLTMVGNQGSQGSGIIEVTNECEVALYLKNRVSEKTNRSYIRVTTDDISIQPGQTINLTVNATNDYDRVFNRNETFNFEIIFDSNYMKKVLPLTIELINPRIALSYPGQITMFLAQNSAQSKAIAMQPIFVTNISQFSVENIQFSVNKEYATQSNVKLSVEPPVAVSLEKGQSIMPVKTVVAEASTRFAEPVKAQILISGRMGNLDSRTGLRDNYNYDAYLSGQLSMNNYSNNSTGYNTGTDTLGVIEVMVYYSGYDCLKVSGVDNSTFNLSQEGFGKSTKITIQNDCSEPVRLLDIKANYPNLLFSIPNVVIGQGQMVETQLGVMVAGGNIKLKGFPLTLRGLTEISQTPIEAKPFTVNIFSGLNFNEEYSKAETGIKVQVCGEGEERIDIPRNATGNDCSNGYCDAQQAAEYIAKKLDQAIRKAESQAYSAQKTNEAIACLKKGYCTFSDIGTQTTNFDLYLKNDVVSTNVIRDAFEEISKGTQGFTGLNSGGFMYENANVDDRTLGEIARTGFTKKILIDNKLSGCGYYNIEIGGVFPVNAEGVVFTMPIITIKTVNLIGEGRINTKECRESIENLINFTPVDEKYSLKDTGGTWLTSIETEKSLEKLAEELSKKLFKNSERIGFGNGNKIVLKEGALTNALAEICLIGGITKTIEVKVNPSTKGMNEQTRKAFEQELSKMITNAVHGNFGNNCLVRNGDAFTCVRLEDASGLGEGLKLKMDSKQINMSKEGGCVTGEIVSNIPEEVVLSVKPHEIEKKFIGITGITIEDVTTGQKIYDVSYLTGEKQIENVVEATKLELMEQRTTDNYARKIKVCVQSTNSTSTENYYLQSSGVQFIVKAINKNAGDARGTLDEDGKITLITDSLHPDDLIKILTNKALLGNKRGEKNPYYFTIMWKGEPQFIEELSNYTDSLRNLGLLDNVLYVGKDGVPESTKKAIDLEAENRKNAIGHYFGWCVGTTAACNLGTGPLNMGISAFTDCAIPAAIVFKKDLAENFDWFKSLFATMENIPLIGNAFKIPDEFVDTKNWDPFVNPAVVGGLSGGTEKLLANAITYGARGRIGTLNYNIADWSADVMKKEWAKKAQEVINDSFASPPAGAATFVDEYSTSLSKEFRNAYAQLHKEAVKRKALLLGNQTISATEANEIVNKAIAKAYEKTNDAFGAKIQTLAGGTVSPSELADKLRGNTDLSKTAQGFNVSNNIDDMIARSFPDDMKFSDITTMNRADAVREITSTVDSKVNVLAREIGNSSGLTNEQVQTISREIKARLAGQYDDMVGTITTRTPTSGKASTIIEFTDNRVMVQNIKDAVAKSTDDVIRSNADIFVLNKTQLDALSAKLNTDVAGKIKPADLTKRTALQKIKNFFSLRMLGSIARSAGCGVLANLVGMHFYSEALGQSTGELNKMLTILPEGTLEKGKIYKMIIEERISGETETDSGLKAVIKIVESPEAIKEMEDALSEQKNKEVNGIKLKWTNELNAKRPEERTIQNFSLSIDSKELRTHLQNAGITKTETDKIMTTITNNYSIKLVTKYTSEQKIIMHNNETIKEDVVMAIIALENPTEEEIKREIEGQRKTIENKVKELVEIFKKNDSVKVTMDIAKEMYPQETKQKMFYTIANGFQPTQNNLK